MGKRVLVVEDDPSIARLLRDNLVYEGFTVECAADAVNAIQQATSFRPNLVLLDLMLPGRSGFEVCSALCADSNRPAIIILTARRATDDKVRALGLGADDYVTKPFVLVELLARVNAVLRRSPPDLERIVLGQVTIDFRLACAFKDGEEMSLQRREIDLLRILAEHVGQVVTRDKLLRLVWGYRHVPLTRTVDIAIARLRRKIEADPRQPRFLRTAHGDGYILMLNA